MNLFPSRATKQIGAVARSSSQMTSYCTAHKRWPAKARVNPVNNDLEAAMTRFPAFRAAAPALAAFGILAATVPASAPASARSNFDGTWSVLIVTQKGTCDRAYRYPVKIDNGSVGYPGGASFTGSGQGGDKGPVVVRGERGGPHAHG